MREMFGCEVGLSDHSMGVGVAIASVSMGATVIEKHFTLDRSDGGVDSAFSMEPDEMKTLVIESERAWQSLGKVSYGPNKKEIQSRKYRRSLYIVEDMKSGDIISPQNMRAIRPGFGLPPKFADIVMGRAVSKDIKRGTSLTWDLLD